MTTTDTPTPTPTDHDTDPTYQAKLARAVGVVTNWMTRLVAPDQVVELRALRVKDGAKGGATWAGTFRGDELDALVRAALELSGHCQGVYYTLNPLRDSRFVKVAPRVRRAGVGELASDADVIERRWLLIDIDPVKPVAHKDDSATDDEKAKTLEVARRVKEYMATVSAAEPILCDSGNGHHLLYRMQPYEVDVKSLPVGDDDEIRKVLAHLAAKFSGPDGKIDTAVFNPARIVKFPGTLACKGEASEERPHRRARVLEVPGV